MNTDSERLFTPIALINANLKPVSKIRKNSRKARELFIRVYRGSSAVKFL
jgi:hypothetical protein